MYCKLFMFTHSHKNMEIHSCLKASERVMCLASLSFFFIQALVSKFEFEIGGLLVLYNLLRTYIVTVCKREGGNHLTPFSTNFGAKIFSIFSPDCSKMKIEAKPVHRLSHNLQNCTYCIATLLLIRIPALYI